MNIIDAIKSGKRFKRKGKDEWFSFNTGLLTPSEILADDWEIEEKSITITQTQFYEMWKKVVSDVMRGPGTIGFASCYDMMVKSLFGESEGE